MSNGYYQLLTATRDEYLFQVTQILEPRLYEGIMSIYFDALNIVGSNSDVTEMVTQLLKSIPAWTEGVVTRETHRIVTVSPYGKHLPDLIKALIKATILIMTNATPDKKDVVQISSPITTNFFIHNCYIELSAQLAPDITLIAMNGLPINREENRFKRMQAKQMLSAMIKECIHTAVRRMLPLQHVLNAFLGGTNITNPSPNLANVQDIATKSLAITSAINSEGGYRLQQQGGAVPVPPASVVQPRPAPVPAAVVPAPAAVPAILPTPEPVATAAPATAAPLALQTAANLPAQTASAAASSQGRPLDPQPIRGRYGFGAANHATNNTTSAASHNSILVRMDPKGGDSDTESIIQNMSNARIEAVYQSKKKPIY